MRNLETSNCYYVSSKPRKFNYYDPKRMYIGKHTHTYLHA